MRILYVDDHEVFRETVTIEFLAAHEVVGASSVAEAESRLSESSFDAVLLDYDLPDGKGTDLIPALARTAMLDRVIAVSSRSENNDRLRAAGVPSVVGKGEFERIGAALDELQKR